MSLNHPEFAAEPSSADILLQRLRLDPRTSLPYYKQLSQQIGELIDLGELADGQNLPPERVLAELLSVSRTTVKNGYDVLRDENKLITNGRGGTIVRGAPRINPEMGRLKGFSEEMRELGLTPSTRVLEHAIVQDRTLASMFARPSSARFLKLVRLRLADEKPMSREVAWFDLSLVPELENWDTAGSAYEFIEQQCGIKFKQAEQTIEAVLSTEDENKAFGFTENSPCLLLKRHTYSTQGELVEYVEGTFRGDAYTYRLVLKT
jgi:GntR family transcriptional regulator